VFVALSHSHAPTATALQCTVCLHAHQAARDATCNSLGCTPRQQLLTTQTRKCIAMLTLIVARCRALLSKHHLIATRWHLRHAVAVQQPAQHSSMLHTSDVNASWSSADTHTKLVYAHHHNNSLTQTVCVTLARHVNSKGALLLPRCGVLQLSTTPSVNTDVNIIDTTSDRTSARRCR
jgi:hypothetical protein